MILNIVNRVSIRTATTNGPTWTNWGFGHHHGGNRSFDVPASLGICSGYHPRFGKAPVGLRALAYEWWWVMMSHVMMSCHMYRCQQHPVIFCGCNFIWWGWFWVDTILAHPMSSPIPVPWTIWTQGILWHCFESDLFRFWSDLQWLLAVAGPEFDSRCFWVVPGRIQSPQSSEIL